MTRCPGARLAVVAAIAAIAAIVLSSGSPPAADAQTGSAARLRLASKTAWLRASGSFDLHIGIDGLASTDDVELAVTIHGRITSRSQFAQTVDGQLLGRTQKQLVLPLAEVPLDDRGDRFLSLPLPRPDAPTDARTLPSLRMGVYPVSVTLRRDGDVLDRLITQLVRVPDDDSLEPLAVAWLHPIGARPAVVAGGARALTDPERATISTAVAAVAGHAGVPMTVLVTPETLASIEPEVVTTLRRSLGTDKQLLATPYVEVDASALVSAGAADDLLAQRQAGEDELLTELGDRGNPRTWVSTTGLTSNALSRLRDMGVRRVVVPDDSLAPLPTETTRGLTVTRPFTLGIGDSVVDAVTTDSGLAEHFRSRGDQVLAAHELLADLAVLYFDSPGAERGVVARPPTGWRASTQFLGTVLPALAAGPILQPVTLDRLFEQVEPLRSRGATVVRTTSARNAALPAAALAGARRAVDNLIALTGPNSEAATSLHRRLLAAESTRLGRAERGALLESVTRVVGEVRDRVRMVNGRTFRLTAREGTIALSLVNDNPFPVRIDLALSSEKLEFTDADGPQRSRQVLRGLVLEPGTHTQAVPVRARASATFSLRAALLIPGGGEITRSRFTIISTVFSGVGVILSVSAGVFLLLWWGSHWRTVRRGRRLVDPDRAADAVAGSAPG